MKAIILAAGYGGSLYPLIKDTAQAMLPIRGVPVIEHLIEKIQLVGSIDEIFLVVNHRFFSQFKFWLDDYVHQVPIKLIDDGSKNQKDSVGATRDLAFTIESQNIQDDILIVGADNIFSCSLIDFVKYAYLRKSNPSIGVYSLNDKVKSRRYGIVTIDENKRVSDFYEKPSKLNGSRFISACLYFLPKEQLSSIRDFLNNTKNGILIGNYIKWLSQNCNVYTFDCQGSWLDLGDEDSYMEAICNF
ncbi:nucleotidyltransferase family protein [Thermoproteota archaeon]